MKKWHRIGFCLVLAVCLLLLSACQGNPNPSASDPTHLINNPTQITDTTEQNGNPTDATDSTHSENLLSWENIHIYSGAKNMGFYHRAGTRITEKIFLDVTTADHTTLTNGSHGQCLFCKEKYAVTNGFYCGDRHLWRKQLPYANGFFEGHSLILVGTKRAGATRVQDVTDVTYSEGVLRITNGVCNRRQQHTP